MSDRFFVESPIRGESVALSGQEATHLAKVLRARIGQEIVLFDGSGFEFLARITAIDRHNVECQVLETRELDREVARSISLAVALPKGDRQKVLVEKLTELGVAELTPLKSERAVVQPDEQTVDRLRRTVIEASKQCGRNRLLIVNSPCEAANFFATANPKHLRLIAHPDPKAQAVLSTSDLVHHLSSDVTICIGPEGGFTDNEIAQALSAKWQLISLGPRVLRIETAAIALAAIVAAHSPDAQVL